MPPDPSPSISVIIPTLNEAGTIRDTLLATAGLGFREIIVVDGGSTDRTRDIAAETASDLRRTGTSPLLLLTGKSGRAVQLNTGAQAAGGEILLFLHADTHLPSQAKFSIETALADPPAVGGRFDVQFDIPSVWGYVITALMNLRSRLSHISTGDQALFVRKAVFEELGGFPEIPLMEDIEFSARLKRRGRIVALRDVVTTSDRRWRQRGPLRTIALMWSLRFLYRIGVSPHRLARLYPAVR
ncbi:MAG: TIGR04283 family arsenosugar biosynthesis glycosyltransferase [Nitrospira sp.]|nr:TIGR04283 family arsenosugar biosynthesis glycosyltransferase [Nitrospira sp.]